MMSPARFAIVLILVFFVSLCSVADKSAPSNPKITAKLKQEGCEYVTLLANNNLIVRVDQHIWIDGERWKRVTYPNKIKAARMAGQCFEARIRLRDHLSGADLALGRSVGDPTIY